MRITLLAVVPLALAMIYVLFAPLWASHATKPSLPAAAIPAATEASQPKKEKAQIVEAPMTEYERRLAALGWSPNGASITTTEVQTQTTTISSTSK